MDDKPNLTPDNLAAAPVAVMPAEMRQFIDHARFHKGTVLRVAEMLPAEAPALDELIAETVRQADQMGFVFVVMAALVTGRPVSVRHLPRGGILMPNWLFMGWIAWHMTGELPEPLLAAVQETKLPLDVDAAALYVIAAWCQKHRGGVLPDGVLATARAMARRDKMDKPHQILMIAMLRALAVLTGDAALSAILQQHHGAPNLAGVKKFTAESLEQFFGDVVAGILPDAPVNTLVAGTTMRRAVAKVGRNEPCPCGSGKKYKHCCIAKDEDRLYHSSDVAGQTREEVAASPEQHLTMARLDKTMPAEMLRLDPVKVPEELLDMYFMRLAAMNLFERAAEGFERRGFSEGLVETWLAVMHLAARAGRNNDIVRLMAWNPDVPGVETELHPGVRLALAQNDPPRFVKLLEELSLAALQTEDSETLQKIAYGVMENTQTKALGILVSRSMLPVVEQTEASFLFEQILETRDKLNLSPDDPSGEIIDQMFSHAGDDHKKDTAALHRARQNLDAKAQEVQQLKESMAQLQKEITRREKHRTAPAQPARAAEPPMAEDPALKELREKVETLKVELKERHNERNEIRRELQKAHSDLETLRQNAAPPAEDEAETADREEELLLPQDAPEVHPVRVIEFPRGFQQALAGFPRHMARAAVIMAGRLAGGEPAAFVGALRLKATPNVMRQRIGSDYRLLFRLHPDHLQVIDLVNRKDLDRRIKTLV